MPNRTSISRTARNWLPAIAVYGVLAVWHGGMLLIRGEVPTDESLIHLPNAAFSWQCLREGALPLWNPYVFCGLPHLASQHAAALYPPIYIHFSLFEPFRAFSLMTADHYWWLGLGMWAWLRYDWRLRQAAALIGGACFMLSGFVMAHEGHSPLLWTISWTPWILWQTRRALDGRAYAVPLLALCVAMQIAAGYMQIAVMTWMVAGAEAAVLACRRPLPRLPRRLAWPTAGLAIGIGLMTVQFMATRDILPMTLRGRMSYEGFASHGLPVGELPRLFFPLLFGAMVPDPWITRANFGRWELSETTGSMPAIAWIGLLLMVYLLARRRFHIGRRRARRVAFWVLLGLFSYLLLFGKRSVLAPILYHLPVYNLFRIQTRWLGFLDLSLAVFAALGIHGLLICLEREVSPRLKGAVLAGAAFALLAIPLAWCWLRWFLPGAWGTRPGIGEFFGEWFRIGNPALWWPTLFLLLAVAGLALAVRRPRAIGLVAAFWLILVGFETRFVGDRVSLRHAYPPESATPPGNRSVARMREWSEGEPFRALQITGPDIMQTPETLIQHLPALNRIDALMGDWPLIVHEYGQLLRMNNVGSTEDPDYLIAHPWLLSMLNCRYLLVGYRWDGVNYSTFEPALPPPDFALEIDGHSDRHPQFKIRGRTDAGVTIVENTAVLPRAWFARSVQLAPTLEKAMRIVTDDGGFDPKAIAVVVAESPAEIPSAGPFSEGQVLAIRRDPDKMWIDFNVADGPGFLVVSEAWYPGWWARVNGELTPIRRTDVVLRGIEVPRGRGTVYLRYMPHGFKRWALASFGFALVWCGWCAVEWRRRRARRSGAGSRAS
jgi:hypothetical protein